jgi:formyltetrahydrofolate deformylase
MRPGLILKLSSPDQPGIVAKIASYVASHKGNLIEFNQFSDQLEKKFFARLEIDTSDLDVTVDDFISGFGTLGRSLHATWHFRILPYKMRTALLVTQTEHCLNEIIWRTELNELPIEITSIIGNRHTCQPTAHRSNIPFHLIQMDGKNRHPGFSQIRHLLIAQNVERIALTKDIRYHVHDRTLIDGHRAIVFPD